MMKNSKIIPAVFFLVLSFACSDGYKNYSDVSEAVLRWRGVPAQDAFQNSSLFQKLLADNPMENILKYISEYDLRYYIKKIDLKKWNVKASDARNAYEWVKNNIKIDMKKSGVVESVENILKSKKAVCLGKAQVLIGALLTMDRNARLVIGTEKGDNHAWVQEYDDKENLIGFWDPTLGTHAVFRAQFYEKYIVAGNKRVLPQYRPVFSFNAEKMWIHGK